MVVLKWVILQILRDTGKKNKKYRIEPKPKYTKKIGWCTLKYTKIGLFKTRPKCKLRFLFASGYPALKMSAAHRALQLNRISVIVLPARTTCAKCRRIPEQFNDYAYIYICTFVLPARACQILYIIRFRFGLIDKIL